MNHDRCHGMTAYSLCPLRRSCGRWDVKPQAGVQYLTPGIPGPCEFYKPKEGEKA